MSAPDRFKDGYASAERHWKARWHQANGEAERHAARVVALEAQNEDLAAERDALAARLAAVEAALADHPRACDRDDDHITCGWKRAVADVEAALETDTTKEN